MSTEKEYRRRLEQLEKRRGLRGSIEACDICSRMGWVVPKWCRVRLLWFLDLYDAGLIYIQPVKGNRWSKEFRDFEIFNRFRTIEQHHYHLQRMNGTDKPFKRTAAYKQLGDEFDVHDNTARTAVTSFEALRDEIGEKDWSDAVSRGTLPSIIYKHKN